MAGAARVITSLEGWLLTPPVTGKAQRMSALAVFSRTSAVDLDLGRVGHDSGGAHARHGEIRGRHIPRMNPIGRLLAP
jgi:hypothetical protein